MVFLYTGPQSISDLLARTGTHRFIGDGYDIFCSFFNWIGEGLASLQRLFGSTNNNILTKKEKDLFGCIFSQLRDISHYSAQDQRVELLTLFPVSPHSFKKKKFPSGFHQSWSFGGYWLVPIDRYCPRTDCKTYLLDEGIRPILGREAMEDKDVAMKRVSMCRASS